MVLVGDLSTHAQQVRLLMFQTHPQRIDGSVVGKVGDGQHRAVSQLLQIFLVRPVLILALSLLVGVEQSLSR
jgi:hypothetical protein